MNNSCDAMLSMVYAVVVCQCVCVCVSVCHTVGNVRTNIKLGGCSLPIEFFVVDNLTQDVILSAEFFERMGCSSIINVNA